MTDPRTPLFTLINRLSVRKSGPLQQADVDAINAELDKLGVAKAPAPLAAGVADLLPAGPTTALRDEAAFYASLRGSDGPFKGGLTDGQVSGVKALLAAMGAAGWPVAYAAYGFATPWLETARTMQPIKEMGGPGYFHRQYDIQGSRPNKARELGNLSPGDGAKYAGRGYVQLTGKTNYAKAGAKLGLDLVGNPDLAMQPDVAAKILIWGMSEGAFTTKKLADYLSAPGPAMRESFVHSRKIINGQDRAGEIADIALKFQNALIAGGWR